MVRADGETREAYEEELRRLIGEVTSGMPAGAGTDQEDKAIALLAMLSGGVTLARAVPDPALSERIAQAVGKMAAAMTAETTAEATPEMTAETAAVATSELTSQAESDKPPRAKRPSPRAGARPSALSKPKTR
jgi:hypothetical protein